MTEQEFLTRYQYNPTTDKLGAGGFGSVFKAYDTVYNREVAIKIASVIDGKENLSLMKEVELANKLPAHVNIVNYEHCFRITGMEGARDIGILQYYPEGSLATIVKNGNLSTTQRSQLIDGILDGLDFLHEHNVMHRDMKPGNILIAKRGDEYIPKIADFGLSRQVESFEKSSFVNSFAGGSAYYAAPEQLAGEKVRANVDLWSFGVILYELLTGDRPFTATAAKSETEDARQEIYSKIKRGELPANIHNVPPPYQTMIKACLIPDRTKRVQDVKGLRNIMAGQTTNDFNFERTTVEDHQEPKIVVNEPKRTATASTVTNVDRETQKGKSTNNPSADKKEKSKLPMVFGGIGLLAAIGIGIFLMLRGGGKKVSEQDLWISTLTKKDTTSYISYLAAFPQGQFANEATAQLDSLRLSMINRQQAEEAAWSKAEATNTITGFQNYTNTYSDGKYASTAQEKIAALKANQTTEEAEAQKKAAEKEDKVWKRCERKKEISVYEDYLKKYPEGQYVGKAELAIKEIKDAQERLVKEQKAKEAEDQLWSNTLEANTVAAFQIYLDRYPVGQYRTEAKRKIQTLADNQQNIVSETQPAAPATPPPSNPNVGLVELKSANKYYSAANYKKSFPKFQEACEMGNAEACFYVGMSYSLGNGISKDYQKAKSFFEQAKSAGYQLANYGLQSLYRNGNGVTKNIAKADRLLKEIIPQMKKMANEGDETWANRLGFIYEYGNGVNKDLVESLKWYRKAADQGNTVAQNNLALAYEFGKGTAKDEEKATEWYLKAANQGYSKSQVNLGSAYENGTGVSKDLVEAVKWYRKAANQGDANGQANLGDMYYRGLGGLEEDNQKAIELFKKAAAQGSQLAQFRLGEIYFAGYGIEADWKRSVSYFEKSIDIGSHAQYRLGQFHFFGVGGKTKNKSKAMKLFREAAAEGHVRAKLALEVIPLIELGKTYTKSFGDGGMANVTTTLDGQYVFNESSGGGGWGENVEFTLGNTRRLQIWPNSFQGQTKKPKDAIWNVSYSGCAPLTEDGTHSASIGNGTEGKEKVNMDFGYMYINFYTDAGMESMKIPMALCWPPAFVASQKR